MLRAGETMVFMGDSITHAHRRPEELHDCYYLGCGYVNHVAGSLGRDYPEMGWRYVNRGECGEGIFELKKRWERDCLAHRPGLVSVLIGINDSNPVAKPGMTVEKFLGAYAEVLEETRRALPGVKLVLVEPFEVRLEAGYVAPVSVLEEVQKVRVREMGPAVRELAERFGAAFVGLQKDFDEAKGKGSHWAMDGFHPSVAGHELIARRWLSTVRGAGWVG